MTLQNDHGPGKVYTRTEYRTTQAVTEELLVYLFMRGSKPAFNQLLERHHSVVARTALAIVRNTEDANDALQEGYVDAWKGRMTFNPNLSFRPWLITLVKNRCLKRLKYQDRYHALPIDINQVIDQANQFDDIEKFDLNEQLQSAIDQLNPEFKQTIELRYFAELTYEEIAAVLDIKIGTVRSRLNRGIGIIRTVLVRSTNAEIREEMEDKDHDEA